PAATATSPPSAASPGRAAWEAEWEDTIAGAKSEGQVNVVTGVGSGYREWLNIFEASFPGVKVQHQQQRAQATFLRKVLDERKAGIYSLDVSTAAPGAVLPVLKPAGALEPVRPLIIERPDVVDDKYWLNGFEAGWMDSGKQFSNAYSYSL